MRRSLLLLALVLAPGCSRDGATDHLQRARDSVYEKRPDEALVEYRKALDALRMDDSPQAPVLRARALKGAADVYWLELRKVKEAVSVYKELITQCPESPEAQESRVVLAELLRVHFRDPRGAIDQLTAALARNPPQGAELHYQVAKLYFELQDYSQCVLESRKLVERFATSAFVDDALFLQAQALHMQSVQGSPSTAEVQRFRQEASLAYADLLTRFGDSELAPHAMFEAGKLKAEAGDNEKAIEMWVQALKSHPDPSMVQDAIARARRRLAATTPENIGSRVSAFAKVPARPARTSVEAVGGSAEEAARDHGD
ncbi:tetratricopeptide repeat domain protein [Cystobacter fuscus]|uniref:Tetratricopeptide repeat domain protein n=1 Tax=Cystobacter fuscus TaxID=43 RepID=A0A250IVK0_9BACT|nr:tetratricopeptide repeat protein [Cystobacter fuscus]ATB35262.1 tetratricopeptide repeat domain protein [Cystobacter fuscus]